MYPLLTEMYLYRMYMVPNECSYILSNKVNIYTHTVKRTSRDKTFDIQLLNGLKIIMEKSSTKSKNYILENVRF